MNFRNTIEPSTVAPSKRFINAGVESAARESSGVEAPPSIGSLVDLQQNAINHLDESIKSLGERLHPILRDAQAETQEPYPDVCLNSELASIVHRNTTQIESLHRALVSIIMRCEL